MNTELLIEELNLVVEKHKNDFAPTFHTMYKDIITKLQMLLEYEKIGTIDYIRAADRRCTPINIKVKGLWHIHRCPVCGDVLEDFHMYCKNCGQAVAFCDKIGFENQW